MNIQIYPSGRECGRAAAEAGANLLKQILKEKGHATIVVATGASQFHFYEHLTKLDEIAWEKVQCFHLDEYIGLSVRHPASFRLYLWKRFISRLSVPLKSFFYLDGQSDPLQVAAQAGNALHQASPIDVAFVGIGENGHLAFNDPPADFEITEPYIVVELDKACRTQQMGEGWFDSFEDVPKRAISMSVHQIMKSRHIVCTVPDQRKANAVKNAVEGEVTPTVPASILQLHPDCQLFLDKASASMLEKQ